VKRTIIRGGLVIAAPPAAPNSGATDILIEGSRIIALGENLAAHDAEEIDAVGRIIIPGLVNAHMHTWQSGLRGVSADWNLLEYLVWIHGAAAPLYTEADLHVGTLAGALNQIACGTTTLGDWCHNAATPGHADAAVEALTDAGIRAVFFHGVPRGGGPHDAGPHPATEVDRLLAKPAFADDGLLTLGLAAPGPLYSPFDVAQADLSLARDRGLVISMHHSGGPPCPPEVWTRLFDQGLLGPHANFVHANQIDADLLKRLIDVGVSFTITPEVELNDGHGFPITGKLRALGAAPSLGIDIETGISGELLIAARVALAHVRGQDYEAFRAAPDDPPPARLTAGDALAWATIEGARALGLQDRIGSLEPGKQADLVMIDARALNLWPNNDPTAMALQASLANIEAVMIGGVWRKQAGRLLYGALDSLRVELEASGARIAAAANLPIRRLQA